jgi:proteasome activator subunit 4
MPNLKLSDLHISNFHDKPVNGTKPGITTSPEDRPFEKLANYAKSLPYPIEPNSQMQEYLDFIIIRLTQCVQAKDYEVGLQQWDSMLSYWLTLKYPFPKEKRILLAKLYFHLATLPAMPTQVVAVCADALRNLVKSSKVVTVEDLRLPWRPIYDILHKDIYLSRRQFEYTQLSWIMGYIASNSRRFFHPAAIDEMLSTFVPQINGTDINTILLSQYYLCTFLPTSHPQKYLRMLCRLWESINSYAYDDRMLQFLAKLTEIHLDPSVSDPRRIEEIPDDERSEGEGRPSFSPNDGQVKGTWQGIVNDVGIFTENEWRILMSKCLASMEIPLADSGSLTTGPAADRYRFELDRLPKPSWRIESLAKIIVYSMTQDGIPAPVSTAGSPLFTPLPSGISTPVFMATPAADYLSAPLSLGHQTYIGGSRALDSLARLIASTESFFHPSNSGAWTNDLTAFMRYITYEFNKRWYYEQQPDCKTPPDRRLTTKMRRELVKCFRTVTLLAMFSQDSTTVSNVQSCLKSLSAMEPDLILHPILERAIPSLESLVETQRTIAVIKALGAVVPALASRSVYYGGGKHLVSILQLLVPGIDLNDSTKTLCTTAFLADVFQYIKIGDLTTPEDSKVQLTDSELTVPSGNGGVHMPTFTEEEIEQLEHGLEPYLSQDDEDELLKTATGGFADWVASFIRRVILLLENLPEEGPNGHTGGTTEVKLVDAVTECCRQICVHLSEPLFDLVLNMVYDFASKNARSNAVRAVHQLVQAVTNANAPKALKRFIPLCIGNIRHELENGASSVRTTSTSRPLSSDATFHWNLAILRGCVFNDGGSVVKYKAELMSTLKLLQQGTFSKRGFASTGKLMNSLLLTLTHTYPLENKFVNAEEWNSTEFKTNHHLYWGKLYKEGDIKLSWHVPSQEEIDFTIQIFRELVEPALVQLEELLEPGQVHDHKWRNDFCRHLTFVRGGFNGIPSFIQDNLTSQEYAAAAEGSDVLNEIPEMIAHIEPILSGFCLNDRTDPRHQYMTSLRRRFGQFLHKASVSLMERGEANTVDAVYTLIKAMRAYFLAYGDSQDSYYVNESQYNTEKDVACLFGGQKQWPRSVLVRRARYYHSARLRWNALERRKGPLEDTLIRDLGEWSLWHYAVIREASQSLLDSVSVNYDGVRKLVLPKLYASLAVGTENDRMKGALWTFCFSSFIKYTIAEYTLVPELLKNIFACQHNEKPSIQSRITTLFDYGLISLVEPNFLVYEMPTPHIEAVVRLIQAHTPPTKADLAITEKCRLMRLKRLELNSAALEACVKDVLQVAASSNTHWRYAVVATRCLRTLVRRDRPINPEMFKFFLEKTNDVQSDVRYYAQRAIMKIGRNIKHRTTTRLDPCGLALGRNHNPLSRPTPMHATQAQLNKILADYKEPIDLSTADSTKPTYLDRGPQSGWLVWNATERFSALPSSSEPTFPAWDQGSVSAIGVLRELASDPSFWKRLSTRYSEEQSDTEVTLDNVSVVKTIFQLLNSQPWEALRPTLETLLEDKNKDKQRAAAEFLAGVIAGSKNWTLQEQDVLWSWFTPRIPVILRKNIKTETLSTWKSFLETVFHRKDPRRLWPVLEFILKEFNETDYNGESSFDAFKSLSLMKGIYIELKWKFSAWLDNILDRAWPEIKSEHEDV